MSKGDLVLITNELGGLYGTYHPFIAIELGLPAAVILGRLVYWNKNGKNRKDGYFFKTTNRLYLETGVKEDAQKRALNKLRSNELIHADKYDHRHRRLFKVNMPSIIQYVKNLKEKQGLDDSFYRNPFTENRRTYIKKNHKDKSGSNPTNQLIDVTEDGDFEVVSEATEAEIAEEADEWDKELKEYYGNLNKRRYINPDELSPL